ncbi:YDG domain-containing protein, partial [Sphingomonas sp. NPDC079357]|uniref:YDG domain-containing protein n=1 Tax=Sphingomonas sp. NPDC079357 TaxID=3364518 RepID=UPI00384AAE71
MKSFAIRSQRSLFARLPIFGLSLCGLLPGVTPVRAQTLPTGGQVVVGQAAIEQSGMGLTIRQESNKAIIDWNDFSIGKGGSVRVENGSGATLNRVTGANVSSIDGLLSASGSVYLINRNGIVFGREGRVDVGGSFVASTQDLTNERFLAGGSLTLAGASEASIINYGRIGAAGGDVALVAAKVVNEGSLEAANGSVGLLAGYQVLLRDRGLENGRFSVVVGGNGTSATNVGAIRAAEAELRAQGGNVYALAGNTAGIVNAQGVDTRGGRIFLTAEGGEAQLTGTLRARTADGAGGKVEVTAKNVLVGDKALVDASGTSGGTVLIGGDWQGGADSSLALADHAIGHADAVVMADSAKVDVSGSAGKGGAAVLWSDAYTNFLGSVDAQGTLGGGRVETSSKGTLQALGSVNALGGQGAAGQWLLDPSDITITSGTTNGNFAGTSPLTFTPTASTSTADVAAINSALNAGTNVLIATGSSGGGNGDITLAAGTTISKSSGASNAKLVLNAYRSIILNGAVDVSGSGVGKLDLVLGVQVGSTNKTGNVAINNNIKLNGGNLNVGGGADGDDWINTAAGDAATISGAKIDAGGGNIWLWANTNGTGNGITISGASSIVTKDGGNISLNGGASSAGSYGIKITSDAKEITAGTGGLFLDGQSTNGSATVPSLYSASTALISSSGNLRIIGTRGLSLANAVSATGAAGSVTFQSVFGDVTVGAVSGPGDIKLTAAKSITAGAITQNGAGQIELYSGNALNLTSGITKSGGVGDSTLRLKSDSDVTVSSAIAASAGAGKLNVYLNSRFKDGALGAIKIASNITTQGGDIAGWGGSVAPVATDPTTFATAGTAKANGDNFGVQVSGSSTVLNAGGGNIGFAGEQTNTAVGAAGTAAVRFDAGTTVKTSGSGAIGIKAVGNNNYGADLWGNVATTAGAIVINGSSAGGAFGGVGTLLRNSASISSVSGDISLTGTATGADTALMINSDSAVSVTSTTGNISLTGTSSGTNSVEGIAIVGTGGGGGANGSHTIKTGGAITMTATGGVSGFSSDTTRPKSAILIGRTQQSTSLILQSGGALTLNAAAATGAASVNGYLTTGSTIVAGGALSINAGANADKAISITGGSITAGGATEIRSATGAIALPDFTSNGGTVTIAAASGGVGIGNITLATTGDTLLSGTTTSFGTITKKASATGNSTLTIKSAGDINVNSAITAESGAGKFNINLNSRATDSASGAITVSSTITSLGGDINLYGGSATDKSGSAASSSGTGLFVSTAGLLDAGGGNILMRGANTDGNSTVGVSVRGAVRTTGTGTITAVGSTVASYTGLIIEGGRLSADQGSITLQGTTTNANGTSKDGSGIRITGSSSSTVSTNGDLTLTGTSTKYVGILVDTTATSGTLSGKNVKLTGSSLGGADSRNGILFNNTNAFAVTALGKLSIIGVGGSNASNNSSASAISFGSRDNVAKVNMTAGAGGVVIDGTGADTGAGFSVDNWTNNSASPNETAPGLTINSAGAVNITGNKSVYYRGTITQTGGGASVISTSSGLVYVNSYTGTNADALTISSAAGAVSTFGAISTSKDLTLKGTTTVTATNSLTSGAALTITGNQAVSTQAISQTGTTGLVSITSANAAVTTGAIDLKTAAASNIKAAGALTTGAITLNGSTALTLDAGAALTPASITRKSTSTANSSLTLLSASDVTISNAITTEAGANKMDVTIASRSGGAATGSVGIFKSITTQGGAILIGGGDASASGAATGNSNASGLYVTGTGALDARRGSADGGAITLRGTSIGSMNGVGLQSGSSVQTSGNAAISITGDATGGTGRGLNILGTTIQSGSGDIKLTGKAGANVGIAFDQSSASSVTTTGNVTLLGTGVGGIGVWKTGTTALTISGKDVSIEGDSTTSGNTKSQQGILFDATGAVTITGSNSVTLTGAGGVSAPVGNSSTSAIAFGSNDYNTPVTINAGAGGLNITATADSGATWGFDNYSASGRQSAVAYNVTGGALNVSSNKTIYMFGAITQTGNFTNSITSSGGGVQIAGNSNSASFDGALTASGQWIAAGNLTLGGASTFTGGLASNDTGTISTGTISAKSSLAMTALKSISTGTITQPAATNSGALSLNAGTTLTTGAINWATGDMTLSSVSNLTPAAITKIANAAGTSTLTVNSDGNVTIANGITAAAGAGKLNVTLNGRAHDATTGTVTVSSAIATRGGTILLRGGSATSSPVVDPSVSRANYLAFSDTLTATGAQISLADPSQLNAGGGDIEIRGVSATTGLGLTSANNASLSTTGAGAIRLYGYSASGGSGQGSGVNLTGVSVTAGTGGLTVYGKTLQNANSDAVHIENAIVTAAGGDVLVGGSGDALGSTGGNLAGVVLKGSTVGFSGTGQTGKVAIGGQGGGGASGNVGVYVSASSITSASSGATTITGTGGGGSGTTNYGIYLDQGSGSTPLINTTGSGAVTLDGRVSGGTSLGIYQGPNGAALIGAGGSGGLTLIANAMALNNGSGAPAKLNTTGALTLRPQAGGAFVVDGNILPALISANAYRAAYGSVTFGSLDAASLSFNTTASAKTYSGLLSLLSGGAIAVGGTDGLTASGGLALNAVGAVTQSVDVTTGGLSGSAGSLALTRSSNAISGLGKLAVTGNLSLTTQSALTINDNVTTQTGLIRAGSDLTIASNASVVAAGGGTPLNLTTGTKVINNAGASALSTPNGRWLLWSQSSASDSLGGLKLAFRQYGAVFGSTTPALDTGNGVLYNKSPSISVALTGTYSRDYDGTTDANLAQTNFLVTGLNGTEHATVYSTASFDTKDAGTGKTVLADDLAVVVRDGTTKVYGYQLGTLFVTGTIGVITPKLLTAGLTGAVNRVYDSGKTATLQASNYTLTGVIGSEAVSLVMPTGGLYSDKNVGTNKLVTVTGLSLTGDGASNYAVAANVSGNVGAITPFALTAGLTGSVSKVYDGATTVSLTTDNVALTGVFAGDKVSVANGVTGTFANRHAGTGKVVSVSALALTNDDAANYTVGSNVSGNIGTITPKALLLTATTDNKTYDGTISSGGIVQANGLVEGDSVAANQSFDSRNAGSRKLQVNDAYTITDGNGGANYVVTKGIAADGTISQRLLSTSLIADDKVYDGKKTATGSFTALTNKIDNDDVALDTSLTELSFLDRHAGNGKAVTVAGYGLKGTAAGNYLLAAIGNGAANIKRATLTISAVTDSKTYDGNVDSALKAKIEGLIDDDTASAIQVFDGKNAGDRLLKVKVNGWTINDGNNGNDYTVVVNDAAGTIVKKTISGLLTNPISKAYDGTDDAILSGASLQGIVGGDSVSVSSTSAHYADKNTGINKLVTVSGMVLGGTDGDNYVLQSTDASGNVGTITARVINTATTGTGGKIYDGSTALAHDQVGTLAVVAADADTRALLLTDGVSINADDLHGTLADRNAGTGKVATLTGFSLVNNNLGNFVLAGATVQGIVDVARKALTLNAATDSKTYDGKVDSAALVKFSGLIVGDTVDAQQAFEGKDAGSRQLYVTRYTVADGNGGANYAVTTNTADGLINKRVVTTTVSANDKVYDGKTDATGTFGALRNLVQNETVSATGTLTFADRNAGTDKAVTVSDAALTGADARNYTLAPVADGTASITKAALKLTAGVDRKTYDGSTASSGIVVVSGLISGDSYAATQHFDAKNAGARVLSVDSGYSINDGNGGGNYDVTLATSAGLIDKRVLTTAITVETRDYDGTTNATGTFGTLQNVVDNEDVTVSGGVLSFADRNAGAGKAVTVTGATLGGGAAGNYVLSDVARGTGTINARALLLSAVDDSKIYDGTVASGGAVQATGLITGDAVIASQVFASRTAGTHDVQVDHYAVSDGNGGQNYVVTLGSAAHGTIDKRVINAAVTVNNKVYDGGITASGTFTGLSGVVDQDAVQIDAASGVLKFLDRNVGNGKAVVVTGATLSGADAGNYTLGSLGSGTANITKATLKLTASAVAKTYDGTTASDGAVDVTGLIGDDTISGVTQAFDSKKAGSRTLSADHWLISDGNGGGNYQVVKVDATSSIDRKTISSSLSGSVTKVYDGTDTATILPANLSGVVSGDAVSVTATSAQYDGVNVGSGKSVTVTGMALAGDDAENYVLDQDHTSANIGSITARQIVVTVGGSGSKTYDRTTALSSTQLGTLGFVMADGDLATQTLLSTDNVTLGTSSVSGIFADGNAGTGKGVTLTGYTLTGNGLGNYALVNASVQGLADIKKAILTLTAASDHKTYDGTRASNGTVKIEGVVTGDEAFAKQAFAEKNAGDRTLLIDSYTVSDGNDGGNYSVRKVEAVGTIDKKTISGSLSGTVSKVYDRTVAATILPTNLSGVIDTDRVTVTATTAEYVDRNVGTNKLVTVSGMTLTGDDASNYVLDSDHAAANVGEILARQVVITASGAGAKTYDGTALVDASHLGSLVLKMADGDDATTALLTEDAITLDAGGIVGTLADRNAGSGKSASLTGFALGNNASGNYVLAPGPVQGIVNVARKILTLTAVGDSKVYDGKISSTADVSQSGLVSGDSVVAKQVFDSKNAGDRSLRVSEWTITDGNSGDNYTVERKDGAGTISKRAVASSVSANDRTYNATTVATGTFGTITNMVENDRLSVAADLAFADRHAGIDKAVTVSNARLEGADADNYVLDPITVTKGTATIGRANLVLTAVADRKVYDGDSSSQGTATFSGLFTGDSVVATQSFDSKNAGSRLLQVSGWTVIDDNGGNDYLVSLGSAVAGTIDRKALVADFTINTKIYDGTTAATGTFNSFTGKIGTDKVAVDPDAATLTFADRNAGANKTVYASGITLTGDDAQNYTVASLASGTGTVLAKGLTLSAVTDRKVYDRTSNSAGRVTATGLIEGDEVVATQSFADVTAGTHDLQVDAGWRVVDGNNGGNYVVSLGQVAQGTIDKRIIGASVTVNNKVYDGTVVATGTVDGLAGVLGDDEVTVDGSHAVLTFADRNAGTGKAVNATGARLAGRQADNYELGTIASGTGNIDRAALTLTAVADSRTYDGTTTSAGVVAVAGLANGDKIDGVTQAFEAKNAGSRFLRVQDGFTVSDGNEGGNYRVVKVEATGTITRKGLSGALAGTVSKTYDRTTAAALTGANLTGVVRGDHVDIAATNATFADANVGSGKRVTVTGMTLAGDDAANYVLDQDHASADIGEITARRVVLTTTGAGSKVYDRTIALSHADLGSLLAQATDSDTRAMLDADGVTLNDAGVNGVFTDRNAGTAKVVTLSGYALANNASGNYVLDTGVALGTADITRKVLTLTAGADSRSYDGTNRSSASFAVDGLVVGDQVQASQHFDGKDAGARTLVISDWAIADGNDGGNYAVKTVNTDGTITKRVVTTKVSVDDKVYDGATGATGTFGALENLVGNEIVSATGTLTFANRNVGTGKTVTISNATLTGMDARNYELAPLADGTATITKAALTLTAVDDRKTYDRTTDSNARVRAIGLKDNDSFTAIQAFDGKDAGARLLIVQDGWQVQDGNDGNNYTVSLASAAGIIDRRTLTTAVTVDTREYDGTTAATGTFGSLQNVVSKDVVSLSGGTLSFADRNAGTGKSVTVSGATLSGLDAANYVLASVATGTGTVTRKALVLSAVQDSKVYDGTVTSNGRVEADGLVTGDGYVATQVFDGKNVGSRKLQVATWSIGDGNGGNNYTVSLGDPVAGTITARSLRAAAQVNNKVYDGTTDAVGSITGLTGVLDQDRDEVNVDGNGLFVFADRNAGAGKAVKVSGLSLIGAEAGNYVLDAVADSSATISKAVLTLTASDDSKVYDGTRRSSGTVSVSGLVAGDTISGVTQAFDGKNAGTRTISADSWTIADGNDGGNYTIDAKVANGTISRKAIDGSLTGTVSKVYDGTDVATLLGTNLTGVVEGDAVDVHATAAHYAGKNVGTGQTVTVSGMTLGGRDADNYDLTSTSAAANVGTITARTVNIAATGRGQKTYDGTTALKVTQHGTLVLSAGEDDDLTKTLLANGGVTLDISGMTGTLADRNAGTGKSVTLTGYALNGNTLGNFVLASGSLLGTADVARAALTLTASDDTRVYDGTTASNGTVTISGLIDGDSILTRQAFDSRNAGTRVLKVSEHLITDGNGGGNYDIRTIDATGSISRRLVTTTISADDRVYDGTIRATGHYADLGNVMQHDDVAATGGDMVFANRNVGANKTVTVSGTTLSGADAGNYVLDTIADTTASITRAALVLNAGTDTRAYDGTTKSTALIRAIGLATGDSVVATQIFDGKNAGARVLHVVDGSWIVSDGNGGDNYTVSIGDTAAGAITQRVLTTAVTVDTREYDGTTAATGTFGSLQNVVSNDVVSLSGGALSFADRNAGTGKSVTVSGATLSGLDAANYVLASVATGTGTVTRKALVLSAVQDSKVYDGTVTSNGRVEADGLVTGDGYVATQVFDGKNVGSRKLQVATWSIGDGNGGNNYTVSLGDPVAGTITARSLRAAAQVNNKVYDGTTDAVGSITGLTGVLDQDRDEVNVDGNGLFVFADRNAGAGKAVKVSGLSLIGAEAGNYVLDAVADSSATISKAVLTLTASDDSKVYDGTRRSSGTVGVSGLVAGDTISGVTQAFDGKNAGTRTISADSWTIADGNDGGNYTIDAKVANGTISRKAIDGSLTGTVSKVYDGTDVATLLGTNLTGVVEGDAVDVHATAAHYAGKNVGTGQTVTVSGMTLGGRDADNYDLTSTSAAANVGTITARTVNIAATGRGQKTYDGTTALKVTQHGTLVLSAGEDDDLTKTLLANEGVTLDISGMTGTLADRNAGTGKSVTLTGYALNGNTLGNFVLASGSLLGTADVARAALTLTASDDTRVYDGTTASNGPVTISGLIDGDSIQTRQAFDSRNAGTRVLKVSEHLITDGNGGGNYDVRTIDATGSISRRLVTTTISADDRVYDGTIHATGHYSELTNVLKDDVVGIAGGSFTFADRNAGVGKVVSVTGTTLNGSEAGNYVLDAINATTADIARATLTLSAASDTRAYDGTTDSKAQVRVAGLATDDSVDAKQAFDGKNAGARVLRVIDGSWTVTDGNNGANYDVVVGDTAAGAITQRLLTTAVSVDNKEYDGTTLATGTFGGLFNLIGNDKVELSGGRLAFVDRHAGAGKAVTIEGATLAGIDAANYALDRIAVGTATITPHALTLQAVADTRSYDGTTVSSKSVLASGLLVDDTVDAQQRFDSRHAGSRLLQVADGWMIHDGNGGANYVVTKGSEVAGTIDRRLVSAAVTVQDKVYDGSTTATGTIGSLTNAIGGDDLVLDSSGGALRFLDRNSGVGKAVVLSGLMLGGADADDYLLSDLGSGSATISKAVLTLTASDDSKVYDGTRRSSGTVGVSGLVVGDTISGVTQAFGSKSAGTQTISADTWTIADGNDGSNYRIVKVDAAGKIDRKLLSGGLTGTVTKIYDGTDAATVTPINLTGFVAGDAVTLTTDGARFADRNAGTGKTVTVTGMTLVGDDAANYVLGSDRASADIGTVTARRVAIGVSGHGAKTYDGTMALRRDQLGSLTFTAAADDDATRALLLADGVTLDTSGVDGTLVDRNAGTGKSVTLGGYTLNGNTLGNFVLASGTVLGIADVARAVLQLSAVSDTKTYDGTVTSSGVARITGLVDGDKATATQAFEDRNAGQRLLKVDGYTLTDGNDGGNYSVRLVDADGTITRRALTVQIADATKTAGQADPVLGYTLIGGSLVDRDQITGTPVREAGEQAGTYRVHPGSLSVSDNYELTVNDGRLTITAVDGGGR